MNFTNKCHICNSASSITPIISPEEQKALLNKIYLGIITSKNLPLELYLQIAGILESAVYEGFGNDLNKDTKPAEVKTLTSMRTNVYHFSAAKVYQMVRQVEVNRTTAKGMVSEVKFLQKSESIVSDFLGAYMFAEKDHSVEAGRAGGNWNKILVQKSIPYLEYQTMKDNRVRPAHVYLDGIIRQADDKFWDTFYPPNGWMCRCKTRRTRKGEDTSLESFDMEEALQNVPKEFRYNFGKLGIVFSKDHPYFKIPRKDKPFSRNNFNLPFPHGN
jgi:hypothetical protein